MSVLEQILGRRNKGPVPVATPEWPELDGKLSVRKLTPSERVAFYDVANKEQPAAGLEFLALMAVHCTVIAQGGMEAGSDAGSHVRAFADNDWKALVADPGSGSAIERLANEADQANVLSDRVRDEIKKKSEPTAVCEPTSASPEATEQP